MFRQLLSAVLILGTRKISRNANSTAAAVFASSVSLDNHNHQPSSQKEQTVLLPAAGSRGRAPSHLMMVPGLSFGEGVTYPSCRLAI